jgi:hypothetical protein
MEKTAHAFFYQGMKSLPIKALRRTPKQIRDEERKPLILRNYTLCEVLEKSRQELPTPNPAFSASVSVPENRPSFRSICCPVLPARAAGRVKVSLYFPAICGQFDRSGHNQASSIHAASKAEMACKPIETVFTQSFGGAA